jgi:enterobactin synthetase component D
VYVRDGSDIPQAPHPVATTLRRLLPGFVAASAVSFDERAAPEGTPLPEGIARSVAKRQAEFVAGRACARLALREVGAPPGDVGIGPMRAPVWPAGFVGSITHSAGVAAAVAARASDARSLGIDVERSITPELAASISASLARAGELSSVGALLGDPGVACTAVFAAKEALFKCVAPIVLRYFDFLDVEARLVAPGVLDLRFLVDIGAEFCAGRTLEARFAPGEGILVAAVLLPPIET